MAAVLCAELLSAHILIDLQMTLPKNKKQMGPAKPDVQHLFGIEYFRTKCPLSESQLLTAVKTKSDHMPLF